MSKKERVFTGLMIVVGFLAAMVGTNRMFLPVWGRFILIGGGSLVLSLGIVAGIYEILCISEEKD